jgi:hypothetical protein
MIDVPAPEMPGSGDTGSSLHPQHNHGTGTTHYHSLFECHGHVPHVVLIDQHSLSLAAGRRAVPGIHYPPHPTSHAALEGVHRGICLARFSGARRTPTHAHSRLPGPTPCEEPRTCWLRCTPARGTSSPAGVRCPYAVRDGLWSRSSPGGPKSGLTYARLRSVSAAQ